MPDFLQSMDVDKLVWWTWIAENVQNLVAAILVLVIGWIGIGYITKALGRLLAIKHVDPTLTPFLMSLTSLGLKALLIVSAAGMIGIQTASFIAVLGAAGLAVGLALQGNLANFAGGVLILIRKPFVVGDFIEAQGVKGTVNEINIFSTVMTSFENLEVHVPNGPLASGNITNFSALPTRKLVWDIGIGYGASIEKAKAIAMEIILSDERVQKDPAPEAWVVALADNAVNLSFRAFALQTDFWPCFFENLEKIKLAFDKEGIEIPFPQRTVHVHADFLGQMKTAVNNSGNGSENKPEARA